MKSAVLDSYAILAFLFKEHGHEKVQTLLEKAAESDRLMLIAAPNWAEVCYMVQRKVGVEQWPKTRAKLLGLPIDIVSVDQELAELAGAIKTTKKMSLADCFAAALAKQKKVEIYTGDPEFNALEKELKIIWL